MGERRTVFITGISIVIVVGLLGAWALLLPGPGTAAAPLSEVTDKAEIANDVQLTHLGISTSENYFGQKVRLIGGNLKNATDKPIRQIELRMVFSDYDGKSVMESIQKGYPAAMKPLKPGDQYHFEIGFDVLPKTWNYHEPVVE